MNISLKAKELAREFALEFGYDNPFKIKRFEQIIQSIVEETEQNAIEKIVREQKLQQIHLSTLQQIASDG